MQYNFSSFEQKVHETEDWLKKELANIRTGRATPLILDSVSVQAYGSRMSIRELATITVEDPKTIRVVPWDQTMSKAIDQGINDSGLGLSVSIDDKGLRIIFPELTSERRVSFIKLMKQKLEEARITLRMEREKVKADIESKEKEGGMGEDEKFRFLEELQKKVEVSNQRLDELAAKKEKEIQE